MFETLLKKHKDNKIIIGVGDTKQLEPINDVTNTQSKTTRWQHSQNYADQFVLWNLTKPLQIPVKLSKR